MLAMLLTEVTSAVPAMVASSDDGGGATWLLALGPAGAGAVYFGMWRYYRNTHTSHSFERETRIEARSITENDVKVKEISGTKSSGIDGDNRSDHRRRVQRVD